MTKKKQYKRSNIEDDTALNYSQQVVSSTGFADIRGATSSFPVDTKKINEELEEVLEEQFPKGKCKERGHALVLFAQAQMIINKLQAKRKYWLGEQV